MYSCYWNYYDERHKICGICKLNTGNNQLPDKIGDTIVKPLCRNCWEFIMDHKFQIPTGHGEFFDRLTCDSCRWVDEYIPVMGLYPMYEKQWYSKVKYNLFDKKITIPISTEVETETEVEGDFIDEEKSDDDAVPIPVFETTDIDTPVSTTISATEEKQLSVDADAEQEVKSKKGKKRRIIEDEDES